VSVGAQTGCGIRADGSLWCWGDNTYGQIGDGTTRFRPLPVPVDPGPWISVAVVGNHVQAVKADGSLWSWGGNDYFGLGHGVFWDPLPQPVVFP
jgi:alpha-tubulin suppressor-like RCC1 family protein